MARGRKPKPAEIKKLQGTARKDRSNGNRMEPTQVITVPKPPAYLGKHGKQLWKTQLKQLALLKMLTEVDMVALGQYCKEWDLYRDALNDIKKHGLRNDHDQISPAVSVKNQAFKNMLQIADRFGFVASAREKISMPSQKEESPIEKHMSKIHSIGAYKKKDLKEWTTENGLPARIHKSLTAAGIKTYDELKRKYLSKSLKKVKGIGPKSMKQLSKALKK